MNKLQKIKNETFNFEKAIKRIIWRFKNESVKINETKITINQLDINAVNEIEIFFEKTKNANINSNTLFAKMYCHALNIELNHFGEIKLAISSLSNKLKMPISYFYDEVTESLNRQILEDYKKENNIKIKHPAFRTDFEDKNLIEQIKNDKDFQIRIMGFWKEEDVYKSLNNKINEILINDDFC